MLQKINVLMVKEVSLCNMLCNKRICLIQICVSNISVSSLLSTPNFYPVGINQHFFISSIKVVFIALFPEMKKFPDLLSSNTCYSMHQV